jgi:hypothetical protein
MDPIDLKVTFSEILRGFSLVDSEYFNTIQIKHFTNFDSAELDIKNREFYNKAVDEGLPTRKQRIDDLLEQKIWTEEKNKEILNTKSHIAGLINTKKQVFLQSHLDQANKDLKIQKTRLIELEHEKEELIGFTAEAYASRRINEHYIYNALKNKKGENLFTKEEYEDLEEGKLMSLIAIYNKAVKKFDSKVLKLISVSGFFTNIFYLCEDNAHVFFGKPLVNLSFYQLELFGYGRYYKSMIQNSEKKPPDHISEDPDKLVEWFESTKSAADTLEKSQAKVGEHGATSLVGATQDDLKRLGLDNPNETISLAKKAAEKGGKLTMDDMMKLHGT